jgi:AcrR family transcriptional regulator
MTQSTDIQLIPRRVRRPQDREQEIVRAATKLFVARGFAATRLDDVAREAKVSKGLPYLYFSSKNELFKKVIDGAILEPLATTQTLIAGYEGTTEALLRAIVAGFRAFDAGPAGGVLKLVVAEAGNFPDVARYFVDEIERRGLKLFIEVLKRGIARGEIRPLADVEATAIVLRSPLGMYSIWSRSLAPHNEQRLAPDAFFDAYIDLVLQGLRP